MKKITYILSAAVATLTLFSCSKMLDSVEQLGALDTDKYYAEASDPQAEALAVSMYNTAWDIVGDLPFESYTDNYVSSDPYKTVNNDGFGSSTLYANLYKLNYQANLILEKLTDNSATKKRVIGEAYFMRGWAYFNLIRGWGTPPLVDHVLAGDACPTNCDHQVLMDWCIKEFKAAIPDLDTRNGKNDTAGAYKVTSGAAYAFLGKAQVFNKDWAGAKESLKKVMDSGNYELVPTADIWNMFHMVGDGNPEKILEANFVDNENISKYSFAQYHYQRNQALFLRNIKKYPTVLIQAGDGWGNNVSPTQKFMDAIMVHEPNSARRKAWFASYEEFITDYPYPLKASTAKVPDATGKTSDVSYKADADMTRDEKLMDYRRGLNCEKYDETYANYGYYFMKFLPWQSDLIQNSTTVTQENRLVMRYAEVLLLYAEACAMSNDNDGLKYLNMVAERAGAPTYDKLTLENVKQEKWFEMAWEGCRFWDLVRWGDAPTVLAWKAHDKTPYLGDEFYVSGSKGKKTTGKPHKARINFIDDGWAKKGGGWVTGKHELLPFPFDVVQLNPWNEEKGEGLKQNPGWE